MRIAVNASLLDHQPSGLGVYTENILRELIALLKEDDRFTVYTSCPERLPPDNARSFRLRKAPTFLEPRYGVRAAIARFVWNQAVFPFIASRHDLIYSPTHHGMLWNIRPQIVTVHDLLPIKFPAQYRLQHTYFVRVVPRLLACASIIIADSESTKRDIEMHYREPAEKIRVVYSAVDDMFKPIHGEPARQLSAKYGLNDYVLMVGASYPHKNIDRALEAFSRVHRNLPYLTLVIVGGQEGYLRVLKTKVAELNLRNVNFLGYVPKAELPALYASARAFLYPSLYEGFGLPPLEAMASGCPVVVSKTSSLPEVCGDAAMYVDPYDTDDMAKALYIVMTNEALQNEFRERGLRRAAKFSWQKAAREVYSAVQDVAKNRAPVRACFHV